MKVPRQGMRTALCEENSLSVETVPKSPGTSRSYSGPLAMSSADLFRPRNSVLCGLGSSSVLELWKPFNTEVACNEIRATFLRGDGKTAKVST